MSRLDPQLRAAAAERLIAQQTAGLLTSAEVRRTAAGLGVDVRTVWRWLAHDRGGHPARRRYQLTEADIAAFYDWRGNVAAVRRARVEAGAAGLPSLATLQRAFAKQLTPAERAAAAEGSEGRRRHEVYLRWEPACRNARWETDHKELPVLVTPPRGRRPVKPWVTAFLDCYSRLIMGWALSLRPDSAAVLAAMRRALVVDPERGPFGGVPRVLVPDGGLEFATTALARVCAPDPGQCLPRAGPIGLAARSCQGAAPAPATRRRRAGSPVYWSGWSPEPSGSGTLEDLMARLSSKRKAGCARGLDELSRMSRFWVQTPVFPVAGPM